MAKQQSLQLRVLAPGPLTRQRPAGHRGWRPRIGLGLGLGLALLSGGCRGGLGPPVDLQVAISTGVGNDVVVRRSLERLAVQIAAEFTRIHPSTNLHLRFLPEAELVESVRSRGGLGAGPDLLILRPAPLLTLKREGLVRQSSLSPAELDPLQIQFLANFRDGAGYDAVPFLLQPSLACFDRRRVPNSPARLEQLVALASEGLRVGLPLQLDELLWTATGFEADRSLLTLFRQSPSGNAQPTGLDSTEKGQVMAWLDWLYRANVQPTLQFVDNTDELVHRLQTRQLDWISCNATAITQLRRSLGSHLGVAVLPGGADGRPARPMAQLLTLSFGRDSTPSQRQMAESFALFVLNDFSQNNLMVKALGNMPVNRNVIVPVKASPDLAVMQTSLEASIVPNLREGVGLRQRTEPLRQLLKQAVYGEKTPQQVLGGIEALAAPAAAASQTLSVPSSPVLSPSPAAGALKR